MRMGVREICDVVFRPLTAVDIGNQHFDAGQPVLYLDTAKTSTLEGAATTVYAQGGKGNPRLIGWDGEKTLTFTVEDALISPVSFAMLSGAGIVKGTGANNAIEDNSHKIYTHQIYDLVIEKDGEKYIAELPSDVREGAQLVVSREAPIYATTLDSAGAPKAFLSAIGEGEISVAPKGGEPAGANIDKNGIIALNGEDSVIFTLGVSNTLNTYTDTTMLIPGDTVRIDCYAMHGEGAQELQIDAENFAGYYYIEADTLFREEATGQDLPAQFIIPRGKIQSNFTFTMANSGDPSTFTFTIDAFPAYTKFNKRKKVMAALQIVDPGDTSHNYADKNVLGHDQRTAGPDIFGNGGDDYTKSLYKHSIFGTEDEETQEEDPTVNPGENTQPGENTEPGGNTEPGETTTKTYAVATEFDPDVTYYSDDQGTPADPQPENAEEFAAGGPYYIEQ